MEISVSSSFEECVRFLVTNLILLVINDINNYRIMTREMPLMWRHT